ncbi:AtpZ/AtpI family protein [Sediminibacterium ginsengisoli]|uniref:F0F1-ATPase subunit Ca2+/Mg2+ transporter n=1 Tax=Sediminibacterium ginsengisoli TaxID=413434 RepID=A0A1T4QRT1_9BACT|nr:AtpZ/AtpI family protein [Sediminibacterium ginsengisoli]SKA05958.1 hypothetical protein SAMN04488132_10938 [Sediminibacterium ginsengisoli]
MRQQDSRNWIRYTGLASQLVAGLLLTGYAGVWLDKRIDAAKPVFAWLLPLLLLIGMLVKIVKDSSVKHDDKN